MQPYRIHCLTCSAPLKIDDPSMIGQIFNCPKCFSMVQVTPPSDAGTTVPARNVAVPTTPPKLVPTRSAAAVIPPVLPPAITVTNTPPSTPPPLPAATVSAATAPAATGMASWKKWAALSGSGATGVVLTVSVWFAATRSHTPTPLPLRSPEASPTTAASSSKKEDTAPIVKVEIKKDDLIKQAAVVAPQPAETKQGPEVAIAEPVIAQPMDAAPPEVAKPPLIDEPKLPEKPIVKARPGVAASPELPPAQPLPAPSEALAARLALPVTAIKMPATPLRVLLDTIGALGAVKIQCDVAALARAGLSVDDAAAVELKSASLDEVLKQALHSRGLTFVATGDQVIVTLPAPQEAPLTQVRYAVDDLAADPASLQQLAEAVRTMVIPPTDNQHKPRATISVAEGALLANQSAEGHWQTLLLCEKLRIVRGLPTRSRHDLAWLGPDIGHRQLDMMLTRKVSLQAADGVPLVGAVRQLASRADVAIEIDELSLMRAGISPKALVRVHMEDAPLSKVLDHAISSLGLAWQPIGKRTIAITTPASQRSNPQIEVYPVGRQNAQAGNALAARVIRDVAPESWQSEGGSGLAAYLPAGSALIVRQPYPIQAQVAASLSGAKAK